MSRRKIKERLKVELSNILNESFNSIIETKYRVIDYGEYITYQFYSNSGNEYDLEFHYSEESSNTILNDNLILSDVIKTKDNNIQCFDIAFTLSDVQNKENPEEFEKETNLNEHYEVLGRISYIIKQELNKTKYKLFIIGGDSARNKLKIYEAIFNNNFSGLFDLYYGKSKHHSGNSLFIIRK